MKIAISGAGIAGPALASWLLRHGHEPTLIERAPRLRTGGYVIDFWGLGYTVAERMGLIPEIHEAGYTLQELRFVDGAGRRVGGFSAEVFARATGGRFTSLPRGELAAILFRSIEDRVETLFGESITGVEEHKEGLRLCFENSPERDFDLLVGADGLHSNVRALVFGCKDEELRLGFRVAAFEVQGYRPRDELVYVGHTRPGRQVARFSLRNDRTVFLLVFTEDHVSGPEPEDAAGRKALLRRVFGDLGWECPRILDAMEGVEDVYCDHVSQVRLERWSKGRVMLIGDAAACVSLLAGEGSGLAMVQAYVLAGELHRARGDYAEAFRQHEQRLRPFIERKQEGARRFAGSFAPRTEMGLWLRNQGSKLLRIPALAELLLGRDLRDDLELPDYSTGPISPCGSA